jgi:hypothetical protein
LIIKRWPLHPKPYEHQLLYSWVEHLAEEYGVSYKIFCKRVLKLTPEEIGNLRTTLPENALLILSQGTGIPIPDLRKGDLHTMFKVQIEELGKLMEAYPEEFVSFLTKMSTNSKG